jgi:hypothetical protein
MDLEKQLERLAQRYTQEGYAVLLHPDRDHLPPFARDFGVDMLATRGEERALVLVKEDRTALEADPNIPMQAGIANAQPGWRYDLVLLNEDDPVRRLIRGAREPSPDEIAETLSHAERLLLGGDTQAACVFTWAALEATMRQVARQIGLDLPKATPNELLRALFGNGVFSREELDRLSHVYRIRTEIVHGLVSPAIDPGLLRSVAATTCGLLTSKPGPQSAAG